MKKKKKHAHKQQNPGSFRMILLSPFTFPCLVFLLPSFYSFLPFALTRHISLFWSLPIVVLSCQSLLPWSGSLLPPPAPLALVVLLIYHSLFILTSIVWHQFVIYAGGKLSPFACVFTSYALMHSTLTPHQYIRSENQMTLYSLVAAALSFDMRRSFSPLAAFSFANNRKIPFCYFDLFSRNRHYQPQCMRI